MKLIIVCLFVIVFYANNCESYVRNSYSQWPSINHQAYRPKVYSTTTLKPKTTSKVKKANYVDPYSRISINRQQPAYVSENSEEESPSEMNTKIINLDYISEPQIIAMLEELLRIRNERVGPNKPWLYVLRN